MSEKMYPIPFASLMNWVVTEYAQSGDIFGVHHEEGEEKLHLLMLDNHIPAGAKMY